MAFMAFVSPLVGQHGDGMGGAAPRRSRSGRSAIPMLGMHQA
jgi:hypothetical protein